MGIEPYLLRSGVLAIVSQRLVRRLCDCRAPIQDEAAMLGLPAVRGWSAVGCDECGSSGYRGRMLIVEMFTADGSDLGRAILSKSDATALERLAVAGGMVTRWQRAITAIEEGTTSPAEVRRVLGLSPESLVRSASEEPESIGDFPR